MLHKYFEEKWIIYLKIMIFFVYVDDILVLSNDIQSHLRHLNTFEDLCITNGLALSEKKT